MPEDVSVEITSRRRKPVPASNIAVPAYFGKRLRILRESRNLTQAQLADEAQIDCSYLVDMESGKKSVTLPILRELAVALGVPFTDLLDTLSGEVGEVLL